MQKCLLENSFYNLSPPPHHDSNARYALRRGWPSLTLSGDVSVMTNTVWTNCFHKVLIAKCTLK